jgi:hypothetical protein
MLRKQIKKNRYQEEANEEGGSKGLTIKQIKGRYKRERNRLACTKCLSA